MVCKQITKILHLNKSQAQKSKNSKKLTYRQIRRITKPELTTHCGQGDLSSEWNTPLVRPPRACLSQQWVAIPRNSGTPWDVRVAPCRVTFRQKSRTCIRDKKKERRWLSDIPRFRRGDGQLSTRRRWLTGSTRWVIPCRYACPRSNFWSFVNVAGIRSHVGIPKACGSAALNIVLKFVRCTLDLPLPVLLINLLILPSCHIITSTNIIVHTVLMQGGALKPYVINIVSPQKRL